MNYLRFLRPSRYINNEINAVKKDAPVKVALAFPDVYEVGMSHLGLKILYDIINKIPYASAERAFHPWLDLAHAMKAEGEKLASLESKRPLSDFDLLGFSLQYELSYTSVLNMLDMGGIPIRSANRDSSHPVVIAGGPCTVNPIPMSPFIDAFLIGDGEEAIKEILETAYRVKTEGDGKREALIESLSGIEGVYVPSLHKDGAKIKRRYMESLDDAPYPLSPVVPFAQAVHDRLNIEVSRGCTMGCRFCQAGMIYRPLRDRSPEGVLRIASESLKRTGYEEAAFTSLSAGDYPELLPLLKEFNRRFPMVSVSLPSLRVKSVSRDVLREIKTVRKTGFTIAPEAATDRLRGVINKDFSMEDYERALDALFAEGWQNLKLYYMIGLPTEKDEDVEAIPSMLAKAVRTAKRHTKRFVNLNVSVSPFVPKAHTPFQWCGQMPLEEIKRKKDYLRSAMKGVGIKGHDERMSMLEAAFARGDEGLADLIEASYCEGATLDGWTESFDFGKWLKAMDKTGIDAGRYATAAYDPKDVLPWDFVETGIKKDFLAEEFNKALSSEMTADCRVKCIGCGLRCKMPEKESGAEESTDKTNVVPMGQTMQRHPYETTAGNRKPIRVRLGFSKTGIMRFLSHRELITHVTRAMRRANVQLEYSKGFHPSPKVSFGPPLGVGVSGMREYLDMEIRPGMPLTEMLEGINRELADGVRMKEIFPLGPDESSLQDYITAYEYEIICPEPKKAREFLDKDAFLVEREKGSVDIRPMVEEAEIKEDRVRLVLRDMPDAKVRLEEVVLALLGTSPSSLEITRLSMSGAYKPKRKTWPVAF